MKQIKVLVVDDSVFMRQAISRMINSDAEITVIDTAKNGKDAIEKIKSLSPDIVTMDVEMPIMTGIEALKIIMSEHPVPVIMLSSLTSEGAQLTLDALSLGAADFIAKRSNTLSSETYTIQQELIDKIKHVYSSPLLKRRHARAKLASGASSISKGEQDHHEIQQPRTSATVHPAITTGRKKPAPSYFQLAIIGISTGGPLALQNVIPKLPANLPVPLVVVQHMPPHFTKSLAERLDRASKVRVKEAEDGELLVNGTVYIAPGGKHILINKARKIIITEETFPVLYKPSVDIFAASAADIYGGRILSVIMTGMGRDGMESYKRISSLGGYVIAQDEQSCVVYGMPKSVVDAGIADEIVSLNDIHAVISTYLGVTP